MSTATSDALLARFQGELEERQSFINTLVEGAERETRDLTSQEMELLTRARDRISEVTQQITPLQEAARIAHESRERTRQLAPFLGKNGDGPPREVEYRSAGQYAIDRWRAGLGSEEALNRLDIYHRAAAHQLTGDNPGIIPEPVLGPVINYIDAARPLVSALGPRQLPGASWSRPRVTVSTAVGPQSAEKTELVSQKMVIGSIPVSAVTYGGYVNVSRQNIDWSQPSIMDTVINDLAAQYAIETEDATADGLTTAAIAGPTLPTGTPDADAVTGALWGAAAQVLAATAGQGRIFAAAPPQMMGLIGPLFPPVGPTNAPSTGFNTQALASGLAGSVAGIPIYVTAGLADNTILVLSSAAAEVYEDRIGSLQVVEPSVLGVQVAYAGYFAWVALEPDGIRKIVKTP